jgi:hypothetical protein
MGTHIFDLSNCATIWSIAGANVLTQKSAVKELRLLWREHCRNFQSTQQTASVRRVYSEGHCAFGYTVCSRVGHTREMESQLALR